MFGPMKPEDVEPGTILEDMHHAPLGGKNEWWDSLIVGYEVTDLIKWSVDTNTAAMFETSFCEMISDARDHNEPWAYTNKFLLVFHQGTDGSFKAFWTYDGTVVGVVKLSPKKEEK